MSKKKKLRRRLPSTTANAPQRNRYRRIPTPRVKAHGKGCRPANRELDNPLVAELVNLHGEMCRASGLPPFAIWRDWLETTEPWLQVVGQAGDLGATVSLPPEVGEKYERLERRYAKISKKYPAAARKMGEIFTTMFRLLADTCSQISLEACAARPGGLNPDILGQAFMASLNYPAAWIDFFPDWTSCVELARTIIPGDIAETIHHKLADAHIRGRLAGHEIAKPRPGDDESFALWLITILPWADLPLFAGHEVTASPMILALASQFPNWIIANGMVVFEWPRLAGDSILDKITRINAMLYGLNGFYMGKQIGNMEAAVLLEEAVEMAEAQARERMPPSIPPPPPPQTGGQPLVNPPGRSFQESFGARERVR